MGPVNALYTGVSEHCSVWLKNPVFGIFENVLLFVKYWWSNPCYCHLLQPHKNAPHIYSLFFNCKFKIYHSALVSYCTEYGELQCIYVYMYPLTSSASDGVATDVLVPLIC